ncbi:MAG: hypothetical protein KF716_19365 [Anaerolineae bacterium]|nr:hypothetical protein [Anaerolineae bacterium]
MEFLQRIAKALFGGGSGSGSGVAGDVGLYYYVKSKKTGEIIRLRVNPNNDLSETDEGGSYFVRKLLHGTRTYDPIEVELTYDKNRKMTEIKITGGDQVDRAAFEAQQAAAQEG